jgi:hypothetical protein
MRAIWLNVSLMALTLCAAAGAAQAGWQDAASRYDVERLSRLEEARAKAMAIARSGDIREALSGERRAISRGELMGNWHCRTVKAGGQLPGIAYSWFHCRVRERGGHLFFEKVSGSQRIAGFLYPHESGGYVLLGALSVKGEPMHAYSGNGASAGAQATPDDAIGLLSATSRGPRIEFPYPLQESVFDVIELRR